MGLNSLKATAMSYGCDFLANNLILIITQELHSCDLISPFQWMLSTTTTMTAEESVLHSASCQSQIPLTSTNDFTSVMHIARIHAIQV